MPDDVLSEKRLVTISSAYTAHAAEGSRREWLGRARGTLRSDRVAAKSTSSLCQRLQAAVAKLSHEDTALIESDEPLDSLPLLRRGGPLNVHRRQYRLVCEA